MLEFELCIGPIVFY